MKRVSALLGAKPAGNGGGGLWILWEHGPI